jgi:predicted Zn-dependent protease
MAERSIISLSTSHQSRSTNSVENGLALWSRPLTDPNKQFATSPTPDFEVQNHGSIVLLIPQTSSACIWIDDHIGRDNGYQPYFPTIIVEHGFIADIVAGIQNDGLVVE